jgi:hypothetical protein
MAMQLAAPATQSPLAEYMPKKKNPLPAVPSNSIAAAGQHFFNAANPFRTFAFVMLAILLGVFSAEAQDVTGLLRTPTGALIQDATIGLALNQAGISPGSFTVVPTTDTCGTDTLGNVVGMTRRITTPVVVSSTASGSVPAGSYYTAITFFRYNSQAMPDFAMRTETEVSPVTLTLLTSAGHLTVTAPAQPALANGYVIYVGTSPSTLKFQTHVDNGTNGVVSSFLTATAAPTSNNTVCSPIFNDAIIPSFTFYRTSVTLRTGATAPGFPQNWYLAGSGVDISTVYPVANVANATRFPSPLLANPSSNALQSVASPVTLNDYTLTAGGLYLRAQSTAPPCTGSTSLIYTDSTGVLKFCQNGTNLANFFGWFDSTTTATTGNELLLPLFGEVDPASGENAVIVYDSTFDGLVIRVCDFGGGNDCITTGLKPVKFVASSVTLANKVLAHLASTDASPNGFYTDGDVAVVSGTTNASGGSLSYDSTSSTFRVGSGITGTGTIRPMAFTMWSPTAMQNEEFARATLLTGTSDVNLVLKDQGDGTSPISTDTHFPLWVQRDQDDTTALVIENESAGTSAQVEFRAGTGMNYMAVGHTGDNLSATAIQGVGYLSDQSGKIVVDNTRFMTWQGANVSSANQMDLGLDGNLFVITGNTDVQCITHTGWNEGSVITLMFQGTLTLRSSFSCGDTLDKVVLSANMDFAITGLTTVTLVYAGDWFEVSRGVLH